MKYGFHHTSSYPAQKGRIYRDVYHFRCEQKPGHFIDFNIVIIDPELINEKWSMGP